MYEALHAVGIKAEITGRNDLEVEGKKISGNAQRYAGGYLMHHGTLLWDTDVEAMIRSLNVSDEKFVSKAAKSVRARVGNIKDFAPDKLSLDSFIEALKYYLTDEGKDGELVLTDEQLDSIKKYVMNNLLHGTGIMVNHLSSPSKTTLNLLAEPLIFKSMLKMVKLPKLISKEISWGFATGGILKTNLLALNLNPQPSYKSLKQIRTGNISEQFKIPNFLNVQSRLSSRLTYFTSITLGNFSKNDKFLIIDT